MTRSNKGIFLSQEKYILDLLKETDMLGCKPRDFSMDTNHELKTSSKGTNVER